MPAGRKTLAGVDLEGAATSAWIDLGVDAAMRIIAGVDSLAFTGGSTPDCDFNLEMSPDKTAVFPVDLGTGMDGLTAAADAFAALDHVVCRFVRFTWTLNNSPSAASGNLWVVWV